MHTPGPTVPLIPRQELPQNPGSQSQVTPHRCLVALSEHTQEQALTGQWETVIGTIPQSPASRMDFSHGCRQLCPASCLRNRHCTWHHPGSQAVLRHLTSLTGLDATLHSANAALQFAMAALPCDIESITLMLFKLMHQDVASDCKSEGSRLLILHDLTQLTIDKCDASMGSLSNVGAQQYIRCSFCKKLHNVSAALNWHRWHCCISKTDLTVLTDC